MITLEQWKKNFLDKDTCPWRGPKPMEPGDDDLLVGRQDDRDRFAHEVLTHQLVILHGESGVGKTSFLRAGVIPYLEDECVGYRFARDFSREGADPVLKERGQLLAEKKTEPKASSDAEKSTPNQPPAVTPAPGL